jgi:FAD/FMN-containing dehydrogenase
MLLLIFQIVLRHLYKSITINKVAGHDLPMETIFGDNLPRLRELKKKYDPNNVFRKWHNINAPLDTLG